MVPEAIMIDFDKQGKKERQRNAKKLLGNLTTISTDGMDTLMRAIEADVSAVTVRVPKDQGKGDTIGLMLRLRSLGVKSFLLSMVDREEEVFWAREALGPSVRLGVMLETKEAVNRVEEIGRSGSDYFFIGLVDLALQRGTKSIFTPLVDGVMDRIAEKLSGREFGFGAATVVGGGSPIPNRLLLGEMVRLGATFTLLRTAFARDSRNKVLGEEILNLRNLMIELEGREQRVIAEDHLTLLRYLEE